MRRRTCRTSHYIGAARKDLPSVGEEILDDLVEDGGQAGGRADEHLPRVVDMRRLLVIIWPHTPGWCRWQSHE